MQVLAVLEQAKQEASQALQTNNESLYHPVAHAATHVLFYNLFKSFVE